jgi:hypothetical protein
MWTTAHEIIVKDGFTPGEKLTTSTLTYAIDGAKIEIISTPVESAAEEKADAIPPKS